MQSRVFHLVTLVLALFSLRAQAQQPCTIFYDGFESGVLEPYWYDPNVNDCDCFHGITTNNPAVGNFAFNHTLYPYASSISTIGAPFPPSQPTYISFYFRSAGLPTTIGGLMIFDTSAFTRTLLYFVVNPNNQLMFSNLQQPSAFYNITPNTWYHVEAKHINWTSKTMDLWIDGILFRQGWLFRSANCNYVEYLHLANSTAASIDYDEFFIGHLPQQIDSLVVQEPNCHGGQNGSIDLTSSGFNGGLTYAWSTGDTTQDLLNQAAGTYSVTITDSVGCAISDSVTILEPDTLVHNVLAQGVACAGDTTGGIDLSASGGVPAYAVQWSTGDTTQDLQGLPPGDYILTLTDAAGCVITDTVTVEGPSPLITQPILVPPTCWMANDGQVGAYVSGGTPGYAFQWSTGDTAALLLGMSPGTYVLHIIDAHGCSNTVTYVLNAPSSLVATGTVTPATSLPSPGAIDLCVSGGIPPYTYLWSTGDVTEDLALLSPGQYSVTITDANGCTTIETFLVDLVVGLQQPSDMRVRAWPNPFEEQVNLAWQGEGVAPVQAKVYDVAGRTIWEQRWEDVVQVALHLPVPAGVYFLEIRQGDALTVTRLHKR